MQEFDTVWKCEQCRLTRRTALLDGAITVMGFGFCRAWLVFCLTFPAVAGTGGINWAFFAAGRGGGVRGGRRCVSVARVSREGDAAGDDVLRRRVERAYAVGGDVRTLR